MQTPFDQPDLELMLRGRPVDLPPIRVQIVTPAVVRARPELPNRFLRMLLRRRWEIALLALAGALSGLALSWFHPPLSVAHAVLEVVPPADGETIIRRAAERSLIEQPALKLQIETLPEYTRTNLFVSSTRRFFGLPGVAVTPSEQDLMLQLKRNLQFSLNPSGRLIDIRFRASDPVRAASYLDLLAEMIALDQASVRNDNQTRIRGSYALQLARLSEELETAEEAMVAAARALGLSRSEAPSDDPKLTQLNAARRARYDAKRQDYEAKRDLYSDLVRRSHSAEMDGANAGGVRALAPASATPAAVGWTRLILAILGALAGLLLGLPILLMRDAVDRSLHDPSEIESVLGIRSLGAIPHASFRGGATQESKQSFIDLNPMGEGGGADARIFSSFAKSEPRVRTANTLGEAFRHLLASIWIAGQNAKRPRVLLFTSPSAREGKSSIVANLGIALAHTRRRVLIVEADLRRPQMHAIFGAPANWGLANLLEEQEPIEDYSFEDLVFKTDVPGLYVLPGGVGDLAISSMRHTDRFHELLLRFRLEFHAVLLDTPAALHYPEARIAARLADAVVIVLRRGATSRERAQALVRQLEADGAHVLGAVMNDCKPNV